jgi:hypothetical protein
VIRRIIPQEFVICPTCGIVTHDPALNLADKDIPAPCCGASGETRGLWLPLPAVALLNLVENQDRHKDEGRRIAVVFLAAAVEILLEDVLSHLLRLHTTSDALVEATLDGYQGVARRRDLFNRLSARPMGEILIDKRLKEFLADWQSLIELRNKLAHGHAFVTSSRHDDLIRRVEGRACEAFAELENAVTIQRRQRSV